MSFEGSLAIWIREQQGLLPLPKVILLVRRAAETLQMLHNQQIIHLDVNPANLLIRSDGTEQFELRLTDLGVSVRPPSSLGKSFPANSQPLYMAPEQWLGQPTPATDQYALSIIAYELFTGLAPFQGPPAQLLDAHFNTLPAAPSTFNQRISSAIDTVIMNGLAKRPEERFPSILAFSIALEEAVRQPDAIMAQISQSQGPLRATLQISSAEAVSGTTRTIILPEGRRITVIVPSGAYDGQVIRHEEGEPDTLVILTLAVSSQISKPFAALPAKKNIYTLPPAAPLTPVLPLLSSTQIQMDPVPQQISSESISSFPAGNNLSEKTSLKRPLPPFLMRARSITQSTYANIQALPLLRRIAFLVSIALIILLLCGGIIAFAFATPKTTIVYAPHTGTLVLSDALHTNSASINWPESASADGSACQFTQGGYNVSAMTTGALHYCTAGALKYGDFAYEVHMTITQGDQGGLIFRADGVASKFYFFRIGRDGSYALYLYNNETGKQARTLAIGLTPAIHTGLNISNVVAVVAKSDHLDLYVNNQHIAGVSDNNYSTGQIGVAAAYATEKTEVSFSNIRVWTV